MVALASPTLPFCVKLSGRRLAPDRGRLLLWEFPGLPSIGESGQMGAGTGGITADGV